MCLESWNGCAREPRRKADRERSRYSRTDKLGFPHRPQSLRRAVAYAFTTRQSSISGEISRRLDAFGFEGQVHLPTELAGIVTGVVGLDNRIAGDVAGSGDPPSAIWLPVPDVARIYYIPNIVVPDQTIGVLALQREPGNGANYLLTDFTEWYFPSLINPAGTRPGYNLAPNIIDINVTVGTNTFRNNPTAVQAITDPNTADGSIIELTADISIAVTVAQGATVNVYFTEMSELGWVQFLKRVLVPAAGEKQPTVVTSSWIFVNRDDSGLLGSINDAGSNATIISGLFQSLAAQGVNVFNSIGDRGANNGIVDLNPHVRLMTCLRKDMVRSLFWAGDPFLKAI